MHVVARHRTLVHMLKAHAAAAASSSARGSAQRLARTEQSNKCAPSPRPPHPPPPILALQALAHLSLKDCPQLPGSMCTLLAASVPTLETLNLEYCIRVGDQGVAALAGLRRLHRLQASAASGQAVGAREPRAAHALCRRSPLGVLPAAYAPASDCSDCSLSSASNPLLPCRRTSAVPVRRRWRPWCSKRWGGPCNLRPKSPAGGWPLGPLAKLVPPEGAAGGGTAIFSQPNLLARTDSQFCCSPGISSRVFPSSACCALCFKLKFAVLVFQSRALIKLHARVHVLW